MATVRGGVLPIICATKCGLLGETEDSIPVQDDAINVEIAPRMIYTLQIYIFH
jgi:hypothetical protein